MPERHHRALSDNGGQYVLDVPRKPGTTEPVDGFRLDIAEVFGRRAKLVVDRATGLVLGTTFVGTDAGQLLHAATWAFASTWARLAISLIANGEPVAHGLVVNMIDQRVLKPTPAFMTYSLAKAGLWWLTRTSAQALAPHVRVNAIGPGPTMQGARQSDAHFARQRAATILQRGADAGDIARALLYLLDAKAVTGQLICVDGGQHLGWQTPDILGS